MSSKRISQEHDRFRHLYDLSVNTGSCWPHAIQLMEQSCDAERCLLNSGQPLEDFVDIVTYFGCLVAEARSDKSPAIRHSFVRTS